MVVMERFSFGSSSHWQTHSRGSVRARLRTWRREDRKGLSLPEEQMKGKSTRMTDTQITDVLVVGAGPVGLSLAIDLARRGIACRIIEQSPAYQSGTRGRGHSLRTPLGYEDLAMLDALLPYYAGLP